MNIAGLQKMTLLDFPGKVACTVFLAGCNFRCPFCHNFEIVQGATQPLMDEAGLLAFLTRRRGLLDGVCISGGEPLLSAGLPGLLRAAKGLGFAIKLDTNGTSPDALRALLDEGLVDYVAMDFKNSPDRYASTAGVRDPDLGAIRRTAAMIVGGAVDGEFRTTVVDGLHDEAAIRAIVAEIKGARRYFLQPFVDRDTVPARGLQAPDADAMRRLLAAAREVIPSAEIRGE